MHSSDEKENLRHAIAERLSRLSGDERTAEGRSISRRMLERIQNKQTICSYMPMQSEADITLLLHEVLKVGCALYLPRFEENRLVFRQTEHLDDLVRGLLGVREPPAGNPELDPLQAELVLVPGRAFDKSGHRLGRGNGGYDKWIAKQRVENAQTLFVGVALECQLVDVVPVEPHDARMDGIVTAREFIETETA